MAAVQLVETTHVGQARHQKRDAWGPRGRTKEGASRGVDFRRAPFDFAQGKQALPFHPARGVDVGLKSLEACATRPRQFLPASVPRGAGRRRALR